MTGRIWLAIAMALGLVNLANGLFMLAAPDSWYLAVPGVADTGPFNQHFVRDIGLIYAVSGLAFLVGAWRPAGRLYLWSVAAAWLAGHALFHLWEVAVGMHAPWVLARDFAGVILPGLVGVLLAGWSFVERGGAATN